MLHYPSIDPIAFSLGPIAIHWYGMSYLMSLLLGLVWARFTLHRLPTLNEAALNDLAFYLMLGAVVGGKLGYLFWYQSPSVFEWSELRRGMSFHGGLLGACAALWWASWRLKQPWWALTDFVALYVPVGLFLGRLANFVNGELWGRVTTLPWGMVFPHAGPLPRHPSQLYEALGEGVFLGLALWSLSRRAPCGTGWLSGCFLCLYGLVRSVLECFRAPDAHVGLLWLDLSQGQWLSVPMIFVGGLLMYKGR